MITSSFFRLQALVFTLVAAGITNLYLTQPVLPIIQQEFGVSAATASLTVSVMIILNVAWEAGIILLFGAPYRYLGTGRPSLKASAPKSGKKFPSAGYRNRI